MTALSILSSDVALPRAEVVKHFGIQSYAHGDIFGGHEGLFDFALLGDDLADDQYIDNVILGAAQGQAKSTFSGMTAAKGLPFSSSFVKILLLGESFDLRRMGDGEGNGANVLLACWLTVDSTGTSVTTSDAIAGHAYQVSTYCQWSISINSSSKIASLRMNGQTEYIDLSAYLDTPVLLTMFAKNQGDGSFTIEYRLNDGDPTEIDTSTYPFVNPADSGQVGTTPRIGDLTGYTDGFQGIVHKIEALEVPDYFDIDAWLAAEVAENGPRFTE